MGSHYQGNSKEVAALSSYINLVRAADSVVARTQEALQQAKLSISQFGVLETLFHLGPLCQRELADKLLKSGGNITMVIDNLERRGLVVREKSIEDRRVFKIVLTKIGRELVAEVLPAHVENITREMNSLSTEEQEQLRNICRKVGRRSKS